MRLLRLQFIRFLLVGVLNTAFSYAVYALLLWVGWQFALANFGAALCGIVFSFRTQGRLVFGSRDNRLIVRFTCVWLSLYGMNVLLIAGLLSFAMNAYVAGAIALVPITLASYVLQKYFVFRPAPGNSNQSILHPQKP